MTYTLAVNILEHEDNIEVSLKAPDMPRAHALAIRRLVPVIMDKILADKPKENGNLLPAFGIHKPRGDDFDA